MNQDPDFFGNWCVSKPEVGFIASSLFDGYGDFRMCIERRENIRVGLEKITGTIQDQYGSATFEGELTQIDISFMKVYSPEAISRGAAPNGVRYHGRKYPDSFRGEFTVVKGTSEGKITDWTGEFYMIPKEMILRN